MSVSRRVDASAVSDETLSRAFGLLLQYPDDRGGIVDLRSTIERAHAKGVMVAVATDLLALTLITPPGEMGADAVVGNSQRFGVPLGFGGPHAAFLATREANVRQAPGRIIGLSIDARGHQAYRMALQTREQHIRREKATSNICTAQALLANIAAMYAVYHGPDGLRAIAAQIRERAGSVERALTSLGYRQANSAYFDTLWIEGADAAVVRKLAEGRGINFRYGATGIGIAFDETVSASDAQDVVDLFAEAAGKSAPSVATGDGAAAPIPQALRRSSEYLTHPVFNTHHSETQMMRYIRSLERKDVGLDTSMIPLGSCTMKLNAASEMIPVSWPEFAGIHPFAPRGAGPGLRTDLRRARDGTLPHHRVRRRLVAAELRRAGRVCRPDDDSRLPPRPRRSATHGRPDSVVCARDEPGERGDGRAEGRRRRL